MSLKTAVLVKQVPDTTAVTDKAMKSDGTLNRAALPAVFNPEDLNALEMALEVRERFGGMVTVMTMGPPGAAEILRDCLYRGADRVVLITDRKFAGADTLATSYVLCKAVEKIGPVDLVFCGRQAIDGNTAQVGPQLAEKLAVNQITYVETIEDVSGGKITAWRGFEAGRERVRAALPVLVTVPDGANIPGPPSAKKIMKYRKARSEKELTDADAPGRLRARGLLIETLGAEDLDVDPAACGLSGSPTRVKKIESVVLKGKDFKKIAPTDAGIRELLQELIEDYTFD